VDNIVFIAACIWFVAVSIGFIGMIIHGLTNLNESKNDADL
jgi:hypothetical protein